MEQQRTMVLTDFLTSAEIKRAMKLKRAQDINAEIITPNIERINKAIGQENEPMYLAYAVEYVVSKILN